MISKQRTEVLPDEWCLKKLGDIADVGWGDLQVTKSSYVANGHIAYSATGPDGFLDYFDFDQDGIVLSAIGAGCGRTWFATGKWSAIKNTMTIVEKSTEVGLGFLFQQLSDPNAWPKRGSGQPFISQKDARDLVVKVPPLAEQTKIVEILEEQLSRLDAALASVRSVREKAARFRRSLLYSAFCGALTGSDTSNGKTPVGWQKLTLGDLVSISNKSGVPAGNPILPYVGMEHIESETGKLLSYGDPADYRSSSFVVDSTQVLYGRLRPYLNKVFVPKDECYASREFIPMNLTEDLNQQFLLFRLRSSEFVEFAISLNTGDRPRVKWPQMAEYPIFLPPLSEQVKIVEILEEQFSRLDASLGMADAIEKKASALRRSLLHSAFNGELTKEWREGANV